MEDSNDINEEDEVIVISNYCSGLMTLVVMMMLLLIMMTTTTMMMMMTRGERRNGKRRRTEVAWDTSRPKKLSKPCLLLAHETIHKCCKQCPYLLKQQKLQATRADENTDLEDVLDYSEIPMISPHLQRLVLLQSQSLLETH